MYEVQEREFSVKFYGLFCIVYGVVWVVWKQNGLFVCFLSARLLIYWYLIKFVLKLYVHTNFNLPGIQFSWEFSRTCFRTNCRCSARLKKGKNVLDARLWLIGGTWSVLKRPGKVFSWIFSFLKMGMTSFSQKWHFNWQFLSILMNFRNFSTFSNGFPLYSTKSMNLKV